LKLSVIVSQVDFSATGEATLRRALVLARWHGSDLHVLYVRPSRARHGASGASADDPYLSRLVKFISSSNPEGVGVTPVVLTGDPVSAVADYARANAADLVVVAQNGRRGSRFWRSGVLATDLARAVESPTLTVSKESNSSADAAASFNNILVAIDFSPTSLRALNQALTLAQQSGGRITLLHVLEGFPYETVYSGSRAFQLIGDYRASVDKVKQQLRALIPPDALNWIEVEVEVVSGVPHEAIVTTASERNADLVVIGRTRRSRLDRIVMASTVSGVLRRARNLVLVVPEPSKIADVESKVIGGHNDDEAIALFTQGKTYARSDDSWRGVGLG
jgi:nucleotide-binding universal stress UspA family protein